MKNKARLWIPEDLKPIKPISQSRLCWKMIVGINLEVPVVKINNET